MTSTAADETPASGPPVAERRPVSSEVHGRSRTDEYDWLRAKGTPEVTTYLEDENAWTARSTAHLADLREALFVEIKARTKETDLSVPARNRGWWYYGRSFEGREYGRSCRAPLVDEDDWTPPAPDEGAGPDEPALPGEQVLLDHDALAEGHEFYSVGGVHGESRRHPARLRHRHRRRRALRAERSRTSPPASCCPTGSKACSAAGSGPRRA